ncbi:electron transport complex subunit G [Bacteroidia bacterium]|nr:electron transport complex subunit G [Bacteroidia bacterium]
MITSEPIALSKAQALKEAIRKVTPDFDNNPLEDAYKAATFNGDTLLIYPATKDGKLVGVAVDSDTKKGFSGEIKVIVGFDPEGILINYSVLQHAETPGLGSKMEQWFRTDKNKQSVIGRSLADGELVVSKDGGDVDAITASTISSRAFLNAINRAYSAYKGTGMGTDSQTGASKQKGGNQ